MANKLRPKGDYTQYLNLNASDIAKLSDAELRGIVAKLNDTANKRISRLDKSGFGFASPSYRYRAENLNEISFSIPDTQAVTSTSRVFASVQVFAPTKMLSTTQERKLLKKLPKSKLLALLMQTSKLLKLKRN